MQGPEAGLAHSRQEGREVPTALSPGGVFPAQDSPPEGAYSELLWRPSPPPLLVLHKDLTSACQLQLVPCWQGTVTWGDSAHTQGQWMMSGDTVGCHN